MSSLLALFIGAVAGLRAMTAPAVVAWAAQFGWLNLSGTWLAFLGSSWAVLILTLLAGVEFVTDQLPATPSRKVPQQFAARILTGGLSGAALGMPYGYWLAGLVSGVIGAVIGTLGGATARAKLAAKFGRDAPAAFIEDAVAVIAAIVVVALLPGAPVR
ncbi:DUF4126 family protein [Neorhizobium lilium]|uniref:DUF4126 family protein n=1 Tax=Neorhizobium lilium TaxID=2503024 RepID=A0A3S3U0V0_9HYPH|nr:DUF4126 family protein [Neorhizobium lilium]RWX79286.1 DUF4126 family protein [Neorhizobium lilium]